MVGEVKGNPAIPALCELTLAGKKKKKTTSTMKVFGGKVANKTGGLHYFTSWFVNCNISQTRPHTVERLKKISFLRIKARISDITKIAEPARKMNVNLLGRVLRRRRKSFPV